MVRSEEMAGDPLGKELHDLLGDSLMESLLRTECLLGEIGLEPEKTRRHLLAEVTRRFQENDPAGVPGSDDFEASAPLYMTRNVASDLIVDALAAKSDGATIILFATWIEGWVNEMVMHAATRKGLASEEVKALFSLNVRNKIIGLWPLLELPQFPSELLKKINRVTEARNAEVHYKWKPENPDDPSSSFHRIHDDAELAASSVWDIHRYEDVNFFNSRAAELFTDWPLLSDGSFRGSIRDWHAHSLYYDTIVDEERARDARSDDDPSGEETGAAPRPRGEGDTL